MACIRLWFESEKSMASTVARVCTAMADTRCSMTLVDSPVKLQTLQPAWNKREVTTDQRTGAAAHVDATEGALVALGLGGQFHDDLVLVVGGIDGGDLAGAWCQSVLV